ncbi:hypothetical protein IG193_07790 [Infirmifilum lucidum]|uniref:Uncharacterized protein n=1 Tax=Infirmifilum lucidum TaxID=2776706 RepID=A0A7L9FG25_9CREN|nr:hypothetical protein [Infirmifilum lucidum]QOJ78647.1 hypothetical protein IG193_07790 [Infirmifilum lucidum]
MNLVLKVTDQAVKEHQIVVKVLGSGVSEASAGRVCPTCGLPATYINSLNKFYCFNCKKYVE